MITLTARNPARPRGTAAVHTWAWTALVALTAPTLAIVIATSAGGVMPFGHETHDHVHFGAAASGAVPTGQADPVVHDLSESGRTSGELLAVGIGLTGVMPVVAVVTFIRVFVVRMDSRALRRIPAVLASLDPPPRG